MSKRRAATPFSLSFLDVISCGFGAIILLFVITIGSKSDVVRDTRDRLEKIVQQRLAELAEFASQKEELLRNVSARESSMEELRRERERLQAILADLAQQINDKKAGKDALVVDVDLLRKELAAMQKEPDMVLPTDPTPVGLPVGSNYLVFVIDTSGSMRNPNTGFIWPQVIEKIDNVLDVYPNIEGIQILDADGRFVVGRGGETWLPDTPEGRDRIKASIRRYDVFSNSNPVPGIFRAFRSLHDPNDPNMKMGIYILGDEFTGTADAVLRRLEQLNPADENGNRKVVINAIGFPTVIRFTFSMGLTGLKYANLMREVTYLHGGAFIAVND